MKKPGRKKSEISREEKEFILEIHERHKLGPTALEKKIEREYDRKIRKNIIKYLKEGTYYVRSTEYIIEDVLFVSSHFRNLSQLADHVAFCVRRKYAPSNNWKDEVFEDFFRIIEKKFYTGERENPESYGLKIFPKN